MIAITEAQKKKKVCYACKNYLTGSIKDFDTEEEWICLCSIVDFYQCFCPICNQYFNGSDFLFSQIEEKSHLWAANIVMHYRHVHRKWDNQWRYISYNCRPETYDSEKKKVNNQIKRALLKNKEVQEYMKLEGFPKESFLSLLDNEDKTIELIEKIKW